MCCGPQEPRSSRISSTAWCPPEGGAPAGCKLRSATALLRPGACRVAGAGAAPATVRRALALSLIHI
eukprot:6136924-Lingulodinium_polyedra.AAC.1